METKALWPPYNAGGPLGQRCQPGAGRGRLPTKFEVYGEEMVEKTVTKSGKSGRVYLPAEWLGKRVKVIRLT